ncbi:hypothetical protein [Mesorhizobium sophorae]|uniref:hypothetical protein n=1 Tax=Mesorhizobium sophorae TaxID=1300294 RepID=UPI0011811872|nr:hypothetical protein [Mesorhizobium sophorae]
MDDIKRKKFNHLSWRQWLLLLSMPACVVVFRHLPNLRFSDPAYLFHERIGAIIGAVIIGCLVPYGIAWVCGLPMRRSHVGFQCVLWFLAPATFLLNLALLFDCPTCY